MVIVACKCLNITGTISGQDVDLTVKPFRNDGPNTLGFLKESIGPFTNPSHLRIETKHNELAGCRRLQVTPHAGSATQLWTLVTCLICDQAVYAMKVAAAPSSALAVPRKSVSSVDEALRNDDFAVVFNGKLLTTLEAVNALKLDENYSKIYKVIIRQPSSSIFSMLSASASSSPPKASTADAAMAVDLVNSSDPRLKNLISLLNERLRKETEATEERIRQFTADQFVALRVFRQAAESEFVHLAQKVDTPQELFTESGIAGDKKLISISIVGGNLLETPPLTPDSGTMTMNNSPPRLLNSSSARSLAPMIISSASGHPATMSSRLNALWKRNSDAGNATAGGAEEDEDDLFGVDGFFPNHYSGSSGQQQQQQPMSDCDEDFDDDGDRETNVRTNTRERYIPKRGGGGGDDEYDEHQLSDGMMLAKSLPIPTPAMQERMGQQESDETLDDNVDIAASIKALAKSVHGSDAIFGDLPRPRLRTKI